MIAIAWNTFMEAWRGRTLWVVVFLITMLWGLQYVLAQLLPIEHEIYQIFIDSGLSLLAIYLVILTIFFGVYSLWREIESRTVYHILTRQITRGQFILGKWLGIVMLLAVATLVFLCAMMLMSQVIYPDLGHISGKHWQGNFILAGGLFLCQSSMLAAVGLLFAVIATSFYGAMFNTLIVFIIGIFTTDFQMIGDKIGGTTGYLTQGLFILWPDFGSYNYINTVSRLSAIPWSAVIYLVAYTVGYSLLILGLTWLIFSRRDLG